ncbi:MAG: hypothetical protein ACI4XN_12450 [Candidatus Kurthia intestinigallinarum]
MSKRILTIEDLVHFCKTQNVKRFDSNEFGKQICVRVDDIATFEEDKGNNNEDGFMHLLFKVCHAGENRNMSNISKSNLEKYKNTINYRPVLASIVTSPDDPSVLDFNSHDIEIDDNGNPIYIEKQVGCFTADEAFLQYDEENDKTYLMAHAVIPEEYTAASDIIRRKGGTKVSCEIAIDTMQYDENSGILDIIDFAFMGVCLLGDHVTEGMAGARADIESMAEFSAENNSVTANVEFNKIMIETLSKLNKALDRFNNTNDSNKKGGENAMNKLDTLLEEYGLDKSELDFETDNLSDEELEAKFLEAYGDAEEFKKKKKCEKNGEDVEDGDGTDEEEDFAGCGKKKRKCSDNEDESEEEDFAGCGKKKKRCAVNTENSTVEFELSHDDIRMALYGLLESTWDENSYAWVCEVYDNYFIYQKETYSEDGYEYKYYKQGYSKNNDNVELSGDAIEVFSTFVTESEKIALDMIRSQYEELKAFKENIEMQELQVQKDAILESAEYAEIKDSDEFKALVNDVDKYSVDELKVKADLIFAAAMKKKFNFEANPEKKPKSVGINFNAKPNKKSAYGNLFND